MVNQCIHRLFFDILIWLETMLARFYVVTSLNFARYPTIAGTTRFAISAPLCLRASACHVSRGGKRPRRQKVSKLQNEPNFRRKLLPIRKKRRKNLSFYDKAN
jgi:hypothetical protein